MPAAVISVLCLAATGATAHELSAHSAQWGRTHYHGVRGTIGPSAARALRRGYLVPGERAYAARKRVVTRRASGVAGPAPAAAAVAPTILDGFDGLAMEDFAPSDSTSAIGTKRFLEFVNTRAAIYSRSGIATSLLAAPTLNRLMGAASLDQVFDPQIIWDPTTKRFYYAAVDIVSSTENRLLFGFSKTAAPSGASSFCKYLLDYGAAFPDYPKLGDSRDFMLFGVNAFSDNGNSGMYLGSDLIAVSKPAAGITKCPRAGKFKIDARLGLRMANGQTLAFTPVPANELDTTGVGWAVARSGSLPGSSLSLFKVTRKADGHARIQRTATRVAVASYGLPANAPQGGTANVIDTADARPTQAVAAIDPLHSRKLNIWVQHTVGGGAGAEVRWYEINPARGTVTQDGVAKSASLYAFNGSIAPNRAVSGSSAQGGGSMVLQFNTSSSSTFPAIGVVSKRGAGAQSGLVLVKSSSTFESDFSCSPCRWGDYSAVTPDPSASSSSRLWITNQYTGSGGEWATWNAIVAP